MPFNAIFSSVNFASLPSLSSIKKIVQWMLEIIVKILPSWGGGVVGFVIGIDVVVCTVVSEVEGYDVVPLVTVCVSVAGVVTDVDVVDVHPLVVYVVGCFDVLGLLEGIRGDNVFPEK